MPEVSEDRRLLIAARQWLEVLISELDLDPATTRMEAVGVSPEGRRTLATISLQDTLDQIDALGVTVTNFPDNDDDAPNV